MPTTTWRSCARRSTISASPPTTNIIVSADHGFSTISKESKTSPSAKVTYDDTPKDFLPMGFLALDLAKALDLPLFDPNDKNARVADECPSQGRQRPAGQGSRQARPRGRHQRRIGPDLSAEQGQEAGGSHHQGAARPGLRQRAVRRRQARTFPRHPADVADRPEGQGGDAHPLDRGQFPLLCGRMRRADQLLGRNRRYRAAAGPGHAWQLRPRRHHELHGGDRAGLQGRLCRSAAGQQRRCRHDHRAADGAACRPTMAD